MDNETGRRDEDNLATGLVHPEKSLLHFKPLTDKTIVDKTDLADIIYLMGRKPEECLIRSIAKMHVQKVLECGTDRHSGSTNWNDICSWVTPYEGLAMSRHGINDKFYTTYLSEGLMLTHPEGGGYGLDLSSKALAVYRNHPDIIHIRAHEYMPNTEFAQSGGYHIFKQHPLSFLIGVISIDGQKPDCGIRPKEDTPQLVCLNDQQPLL